MTRVVVIEVSEEVVSLSWSALVAEYPRFEQFVFGEGQPVTGTEWVAESVRAGADQFRMPSEKSLAQLWLYSFCNAVVTPAVFLMVEFEELPSLDFASGSLSANGFWGSFSTASLASSQEESGASLARSIAPLIDALSAEFGVRPAPLWAIVADGLRQSALEAGNASFDPAAGVRVAAALSTGFAAAAPGEVPAVEYQAIVDGAFLPVESAEDVTDEMYVLARRTSCCMVYRSPGSGLCTSCPKQDATTRDRALMTLAEYS
ncbi:(2Fe-2S)-binding protein [Corynebacterium sp. H127]|uniref:(2Fe-2S)-binding protein n=1 Tax=Corynebacterium sp. H127 TaxID=3133418 RepID=UPI0030A64FD7